MQVYEESIMEGKRPCARRECPQCQGKQVLHKHGNYRRYRGVEGQETVEVQRYLCRRCGHTWSVIPAGMMPYRNLEVERFEELVDEQMGLASGGARPPPATEKEHGCIRRTITRLSKRIPLLCRLFGQQMPLQASKDVGCFWRALRKLGSTVVILQTMARQYKTSLLGCYRSLRAYWEREIITVCEIWQRAGPSHKTVY